MANAEKDYCCMAQRYIGSVQRRILIVICSLACIWGSQAQSQENCGESINFEEVEVSRVVDEIAMRTGKKFVIAPQVNGRITIKSGPNSDLCADEAWELFQAALRVNGFVATPINGDSYKIIPLQIGARSGGPVGEGPRGDIVTQIIRLTHVEAREAAASLTQISSERGVVNPVRSGNALIIVDTENNVRRMREVLRQIDRDTRVHKTVTLQNASANEVVDVLRQVSKELSQEGNAKAGNVSIVPVDATNSIIIRAEPTMLNQFLRVVAELDQMGGATSELAVIRLAHQDAEAMAQTLRDLVSAQSQVSGEGGASPRGGAKASISIDKQTNSIIISGDAAIQNTLRRTIAALDVRPAQVLVEAIIVEISEDMARQLGVQYLITGTGEGNSVVPFTTTNFSAPPDLLSAAATAFVDNDESTGSEAFNNKVLQAALGSLLGANGFAVGGAGESGGTIYSAIVTALQEDTDSRVLSLPSVLTLNNETARLQVGQEIPITTGEAVSNDLNNAFRTVSREEVGVILEVTPRITDGETVTLDLRQEISSVAGQIISSSTDLITNQRVIETKALVDDGNILVIGGLIEASEETSEDKVPFLGDIPIAGNLFKVSARGRSQRNLMIFIRPTIVRDEFVANAATMRKLDYIKARGLMRDGGPVSDIERLIEQATGAGRLSPPKTDASSYGAPSDPAELGAPLLEDPLRDN